VLSELLSYCDSSVESVSARVVATAESEIVSKYNSEILFKNKPGVDVMITIFCDFCQVSAKKWHFSQKTMF
jgi:hypothetical protein